MVDATGLWSERKANACLLFVFLEAAVTAEVTRSILRFFWFSSFEPFLGNRDLDPSIGGFFFASSYPQ